MSKHLSFNIKFLNYDNTTLRFWLPNQAYIPDNYLIILFLKTYGNVEPQKKYPFSLITTEWERGIRKNCQLYDQLAVMSSVLLMVNCLTKSWENCLQSRYKNLMILFWRASSSIWIIERLISILLLLQNDRYCDLFSKDIRFLSVDTQGLKMLSETGLSISHLINIWCATKRLQSYNQSNRYSPGIWM